MKIWHIWVSVGAVFLFGFLLSQDALAKIAWDKYQDAGVALALTRNAKLAMQIGNYYFNGAKYDLGKAERGYKKAITIDPKILWGHYQLARVYFVDKSGEALSARWCKRC